MSYLNQAQGSQFQSYLGEDAVYEVSGRTPHMSPIQKAQAMPRVMATIERRRKLMTPRNRAQRYNKLVAFLKTLPMPKQKQIKEAATRFMNQGVALDGYSGQHGGMGDWASALTAAASLYVGYEGLQAQKDAQKAADQRAAQQAAAELEYQRAQTRMAEEAAKAAQQQKLLQAQQEANKPKMSTGTKVAIGAGVAVAATAAVVALN